MEWLESPHTTRCVRDCVARRTLQKHELQPAVDFEYVCSNHASLQDSGGIAEQTRVSFDRLSTFQLAEHCCWQGMGAVGRRYHGSCAECCARHSCRLPDVQEENAVSTDQSIYYQAWLSSAWKYRSKRIAASFNNSGVIVR